MRRHPEAAEGWSCHPTARLVLPSSWDRANVSPQLPLLLLGHTLTPQRCCHRGWSRDTSISMDTMRPPQSTSVCHRIPGRFGFGLEGTLRLISFQHPTVGRDISLRHPALPLRAQPEPGPGCQSSAVLSSFHCWLWLVATLLCSPWSRSTTPARTGRCP